MNDPVSGLRVVGWKILRISCHGCGHCSTAERSLGPTQPHYPGDRSQLMGPGLERIGTHRASPTAGQGLSPDVLTMHRQGGRHGVAALDVEHDAIRDFQTRLLASLLDAAHQFACETLLYQLRGECGF